MKSRLYHTCSALLMCLSVFSASGLALASESDADRGAQQKIILKLSWLDDQGQKVDRGFSLSDMENLPQATLTLELPASVGIAGEHAWQGVPLGSLIATSGRKADSMTISALNGYSVSVPVKDIVRFNPTLVYRRDGLLISVREKGPFPADLPLQ